MQNTESFEPFAPLLWLIAGSTAGYWLAVFGAPHFLGYELSGAAAASVTTICALVFFFGGLWAERLVWESARQKSGQPVGPMGA